MAQRPTGFRQRAQVQVMPATATQRLRVMRSSRLTMSCDRPLTVRDCAFEKGQRIKATRKEMDDDEVHMTDMAVLRAFAAWKLPVYMYRSNCAAKQR